MHIRKVAAAAMFATGASLALAPLAQADLASTVASTTASEIALQNTIFELQAASAGADVTPGVNGGYDTLTNLAADAPKLLPGVDTYGQVTPLETEIYGANPILAGISGATGPYNEFNGALTELYNAYNVYAFAAANNGALDTNPNDYLGSFNTNLAAVGGENATLQSAEQFYLTFAQGDLKGFDAIFAPDSTGIGDINPTISNEIVQLNNLFELDGKLTGAFNDIIPNINSIPGNYVGFDTIDPNNLNDQFTSLVFGAAGASGDPGSYDVLNGALGEFFNASNVGLYALLNGGDILPSVDVIGTNADFLSGGVSTAITDFLQAGFADLAGYFVPSM